MGNNIRINKQDRPRTGGRDNIFRHARCPPPPEDLKEVLRWGQEGPDISAKAA